MSLRRCPRCRNLVERESVECSVCGRSWSQLMLARAIRWMLVCSLVAIIGYELLHHAHRT